jgi:OMF family outer membrane factor
MMIGACFASMCTSVPATAQSPQGKTLAQAVQVAQSARLSVSIAVVDTDIARARLAQAQAQRYPTLDFSSSVDRINNYDTFTGITASVDIPELNTTSKVAVTQSIPRYQASAALIARYNLYTGGREQAQVSQMELSLQAAELSRQLALQQIAVDVSFAYFKLRLACLKTSSASRQLRHAKSLAEFVSQRLREGRIAPIEERVTTLAVAEKLSAWRTQQENLELVYGNFQEATQGNTPGEKSTEERCKFLNPIEIDLDQARQLSDPVLDARIDDLQVETARKFVEVKRASLRPQVSLYASYSGGGRSDDSLGNSLSKFSSRQAAIGLQMSFNLFDYGLANQKVIEAEAEVRKQLLSAQIAAADREQKKRRRESNTRMTATHNELLRSRLELAVMQAEMARQQLTDGTISSEVAEDRFEKEREARDELNAAQINGVFAELATLFPGRSLPEP